jgi:hypothetical protein
MPIIENRDVIKKEIITFFYCRNRTNGRGNYRKFIKRIFKQHFPTVYRAIFLLKKTNYTSLSILLQVYERYIFIDLICPQLKALKVKPIFTIHDSVVSSKINIDTVKSVCAKIIAEATGIHPNLKVEHWERGNLLQI